MSPVIRGEWVEPLMLLDRDKPPADLIGPAQPSALCRQAWETLQALEAAEPQEVEGVAAAALQHQRHKLLVESFGQPTWFGGCVVRALGRGRGHSCAEERGAFMHGRCTPPGTDHPRLLRKGGKTVGLLIQPYDMSWQALQGLVEYCQRYRLEAQIVGAASYHYPSRTVAIVITREGENRDPFEKG